MRDTGRPPAQIVKDIIKYRQTGTLLDIGAGFGRHAFFLADQGFEVTASDPDSEMFSALEQKNQHRTSPIKLSHAAIDELSESKTYDIVVATMVVHFMPNQVAAHEAIKKMQALTKPDGLNVVSVLLKKEANNQRPYLFEDNELAECYQGWKILQYEEALGLPYKPSGSGPEITSYTARIIAEKPTKV